MKAALLPAVLVALVAVSLSAQDGGQTQQSCAVAGTVVDAVTQQPLKQAEVWIRARRSFDSQSPPGPSIHTPTDDNGHFAIDGLTPGQFMISAHHDGYMNSGFGMGGAHGGVGAARTVVSLVAGQQVNDIVLSLTPQAIVTGHVSDATGKAMQGVFLQAMRQTYRNGRSDFDQAVGVSSNKAGEYRIENLAPGKYYLLAVSKETTAGKPESNLAYVPTFYPGTSTRTQAVPLTVRAGDQLGGIDITLTPVRTVVVKGRVVDARGSAAVSGAEVTLVDKEGSLASSPYETTADAKGSFELRGIPSGNYILMAQRPDSENKVPTIWGRKSITAGTANISDAVVVVSAGVDVSGRIRVDGKSSVDLGQLTGVLEASENAAIASLMPNSDNALVKADGSFVFHDVPEGTYRINFFPVPFGFYLRSAAGEALETGFTISKGQPLSGLEFVLSPGAPRVEGTVTKDQQAAPGALVVLIPDGNLRGEPRYYRQSVTDQQGHFTLRSVPPGDYEIFAWEEIERSTYMDPDFLQQFGNLGKSLRLKQGDDQNVQLEEIPADTSP